MSEWKAIAGLVVRYSTQHIDHETSLNVSANNKKFVVIMRCNLMINCSHLNLMLNSSNCTLSFPSFKYKKNYFFAPILKDDYSIKCDATLSASESSTKNMKNKIYD